MVNASMDASQGVSSVVPLRADMTKISTDEAEQLLGEDIPYVDVRTASEYAAGHVPGAFNVPWLVEVPGGRAPNSDFVRVMEKLFDKNQRVIIGCQAGARSANACAALGGAGYTNLLDMTAGFGGGKDAFGRPVPGWLQEGREVETDADPARAYAALLARANG